MGKEIFVVESQDDKVKIERFLKKFGISYIMAAQLIRKGNVKVNGKRQKSSCILHLGDIVELFGVVFHSVEKSIIFTKKHDELAEEIIQNILYRDEDILILNKPAGIAVQGGNKVKISIDDLAEYLKFDLPNKPKLVHRLDRDTSGVLIMARNDLTAKVLSSMFKASGTIKKCYLALCNGYPSRLEGTISIPLAKVKLAKEIMCYSLDKGDEAITNYKVLQHNDKFSLIQLQIITGRTHQVRAHCATSGIPIVGDGKYNHEYFERIKSIISHDEKKKFILNLKSINSYNYKKLCLHSELMEFTLFDKKISVKAPIPQDLQMLIDEIFS